MAKKMFSIVMVNQVDYKPSGSHTVDFNRIMAAMGAYTPNQWANNIKAIVDDYDDDQRAAEIVAWDVYDFLKKCWWWNDTFKDSVTVRCVKTEINTEGRCWSVPSITSSKLTVNLADLKLP